MNPPRLSTMRTMAGLLTFGWRKSGQPKGREFLAIKSNKEHR